jgi:hypothetical protein
MADPYQPADKTGTKLQQAQYWLETAVKHETDGNASQAQMSFKMALKREGEHHGAA